jgi:alanine racemase
VNIEDLVISRREFVGVAGAGLIPTRAPQTRTPNRSLRVRPGGSDSGFDPWLEIDATALRHNAAEVSRLVGGRPILAVVKNNAYGIGDTVVGPILAGCREIAGIACVRVAEAIAMREAGVTKPILTMAEVSEEELPELARRGIRPSLWLPDAAARIDRAARRIGKPIPIDLFIDTGMGREGVPAHRAVPWIEDLASRRSVRIEGTCTMFVHDMEFDREQLQRLIKLRRDVEARGIRLGRIHAAPTFEVFHLPEAHLDMVRPGIALLGFYPPGERPQRQAQLKMAFRMCARVSSVERLSEGESAGFGRSFRPARATWIATLPIGATDGYPSQTANNSDVLIGGKPYRVVVVNSAHTIVEIGAEQTVQVGDPVVLIGPDHPTVTPETIGRNAKLEVAPNLNAFLPRRVVED